MSGCEVPEHDIEAIADHEHSQVLYRHGRHLFAYPLDFVEPEERELMLSYERSLEAWLDIIHRYDEQLLATSSLMRNARLPNAQKAS